MKRKNLRPVIFDGSGGVDFIEIRDAGPRREAEEAFDLQWGFITGQVAASDLEKLRGLRVAGRPIEADADRLREIAAAGGVDVPEAYRAVLG